MRAEEKSFKGKSGDSLSHELGVSMAEIARELEVCSSALTKAVQKLES